jgi:hypothetical protein
MSFTATVENDTIKLPPGVHLADGTEVTIEPHGLKAGSFLDSIRDLIGSITDAPADMAENHDYYAHGSPKGIDRL